ncbi:prepilin-type N-terminal cleavage/methylation domain-containing protein [Vibrio sp. Isolate23]|uniref:type IV pilus modification PilV family protein n=1 Tax=Vibrio sp. Isolate23 TaxID=2908533 RepID=UPI001EFD7CC6|nr:prepilin-type N-terminal cleavage/methylation domain-containing protein [Vibrio sp. Isolate23]MCG9683478.1 prepilin-type N-terminal cleavage/methylation domain-containing protein [Vibrio sp. Isolate23]
MISNQKGVSLIEVLIGLFLVSSSAIGLVKLHTYIETKSDWANQATKALYLAESQIEYFISHSSVVEPQNYSFDTINQDPCFTLERCQMSLEEEFQLQCDSKSIVLNGIETQLISVAVCWQDRYGKNQSIELTTFVSEFNEFAM